MEHNRKYAKCVVLELLAEGGSGRAPVDDAGSVVHGRRRRRPLLLGIGAAAAVMRPDCPRITSAGLACRSGGACEATGRHKRPFNLTPQPVDSGQLLADDDHCQDAACSDHGTVHTS
jgi:hypothetical protein